MLKSPNSLTDNSDFFNATGKIPFNLQNDIIFHCIMQKSPNALRSLLSSLLSISYSDIRRAEVLNPIDFSSPLDKELILDVKLSLNSNDILGIELQTYCDPDWNDRSLLYLCRAFDSLSWGEPYSNLKTTTLIAIMSYSPFPDKPAEFYSRFRILNEKYLYPYSSKLKLNVLNFNRIDLATKSDYQSGLVHWAEFFRATTWEDVRTLIEYSDTAKEVGEIMYALNSDERQRAYMEEAHDRWLAKFRAAVNEAVKEEVDVQLTAAKEKVYKETYQEAYDAAYAKSYEDAHNAGYAEGYEDAHNVAYAEGYEKAKAEQAARIASLEAELAKLR